MAPEAPGCSPCPVLRVDMSAPDDELLRPAAVSERIGLSVTHIRRLVAAGKFPQPIRFSPRAIAWRRSDINAWMASLSQKDTNA